MADSDYLKQFEKDQRKCSCRHKFRKKIVFLSYYHNKNTRNCTYNITHGGSYKRPDR